MPSRMTATFPRRDRGFRGPCFSTFEWSNGVMARCTVTPSGDQLPHDLAHCVKRKHHDEMAQAEAIGTIDAVLAGRLDLHRDWPEIRRNLTRTYAIETESVFAALTQRDIAERIVPFHRRMHSTWSAVPVGGGLAVTWPPGDDPVLEVLDIYDG